MKKIKYYFVLSLVICATLAHAQTQLKGKIVDEQYKPLSDITIRHAKKGTKTNKHGYFEIFIDRPGNFRVKVSGIGFPEKTIVVIPQGKETILEEIVYRKEQYNIDDVEVFGERNKKPRGLEDITRMPLKPSDQIQTISVISNKVIQDQGALTITDAVRNIPGVTLFGSYGGVRESMTTRGFRGIPVLKNGVRMDSQFQTAGGLVDMQGVESIQMIKGSAAVTQGVITDLGNGGGVINVVTKTPRFIDAGEVGVRVGSWGQFRPTFDVQTVLDKKESFAIRMNGAYERSDSYRSFLKSDRVYFNPSLTWRVADRTTITLEGDYLNANVTPHAAAVNLNPSQSINALYILPYDKLIGLASDNNNTVMKSIMASIQHELTENWSIRAAYAANTAITDNLSTTATIVKDNNSDFDKFSRAISRSGKTDKNATLQFDVIGQDLYTGKIKHTAQIGFDYRDVDVNTVNYTTKLSSLNKDVQVSAGNVIDTINILGNWSNELADVNYTGNGISQTGKSVIFLANAPVNTKYNTFGILAQDVIEFNKYIKAS